MAVEFWSVHALKRGDPGLVLASVLNPHAVLKHIRAARQIVDKEVAGGVTSRFVVPQAVLVFVARQDVYRLSSAAPLVLQMDLFHIAIDSDFYPGYHFIAYLNRGGDRIDRRAVFGVLLHIQ